MSPITQPASDFIQNPIAPIPVPSLRHQIVIVGGGAAGITVAAQLLKPGPQIRCRDY